MLLVLNLNHTAICYFLYLLIAIRELTSASTQNALINLCTALIFKSESHDIFFAFTQLFNRKYGITYQNKHIISCYTMIRNIFMKKSIDIDNVVMNKKVGKKSQFKSLNQLLMFTNLFTQLTVIVNVIFLFKLHYKYVFVSFLIESTI